MNMIRSKDFTVYSPSLLATMSEALEIMELEEDHVSTCHDAMFRHHFILSRHLFLRIVEGVKHFYDYFMLKRGCTRLIGCLHMVHPLMQ